MWNDKKKNKKSTSRMFWNILFEILRRSDIVGRN